MHLAAFKSIVVITKRSKEQNIKQQKAERKTNCELRSIKFSNTFIKWIVVSFILQIDLEIYQQIWWMVFMGDVNDSFKIKLHRLKYRSDIKCIDMKGKLDDNKSYIFSSYKSYIFIRCSLQTDMLMQTLKSKI